LVARWNTGYWTQPRAAARRPAGISRTKPSSVKEKNNFLKAAAKWVAQALAIGAKVAGRLSAFVTAYQALSWLDTDRPFIESYQDPPKSLEELQHAAQGPRQRRYHDHPISEQEAAREAGFPEDVINGPENKVRIPALKHWEITGWSMRKITKANLTALLRVTISKIRVGRSGIA
jgi:hypothetical protein